MYNQIKLSFAIKRLLERECFYLKRKLASFTGKKYAIFAAGPTGRGFLTVLKDEFEIDAEFFIDNNVALEGTIVNGLPVFREPWKTMPNFADEYAVIVATSSAYYGEIAKQLESLKITAYMSWYEYIFANLSPRVFTVSDMLEDEFSKISYLGAVWSMMSGENSFIQHVEGHYFAHTEFVSAVKQIVVDAGAYIGDNVEDYIRRNFGSVKIYAFEPYEKCLAKLANRKKRLESEFVLDNDNILIVPAGLASTTTTTTTTTGISTVGANMLVQDTHGDIEIQVYSLDDYFKDKKPPTIIKADIEGMELDMLKGAKNIIKTVKPKMALSIYHSPFDMVNIAEYIKKLAPEYQFAVRNHWNTYEDTILYCWVK